MLKYHIDCKEVGFLDCDFVTEAETIEEVVEKCADHSRQFHDLKAFGPEVFTMMRPHIRQVEVGSDGGVANT